MMKNPFQLISELASGKAETVVDRTFNKLAKYNTMSKKESDQVKKALKHHAAILQHRKELQKVNKQIQQVEERGDIQKRKELRTRRAFLEMDSKRRRGYLRKNSMSAAARRASMGFHTDVSQPGGVPAPPSDVAQYVAARRATGSVHGFDSGGRGFGYGGGGRGSGGGGGGIGGALQMLANFGGSINPDLYYFAKGLHQAGKGMLAIGVTLYATMTAFNMLIRITKRLVSVFKEMMEEADRINMMSRKTRIASGSFGMAQRDIRNLRTRQASGQWFMSDEDYVIARKNFQSLGVDYREGMDMMQKLSFATGESIGTLSSQYFDAIQYGGDQLYKTLGMNNRFMQRVMSIIPEGTVGAREAINRLLQDQELLNQVIAETPRTIDEMKQRIKGFKDLMVMNIVGDLQDPTSLYSVYRDTFRSIADWLVAHQKQIARATAFISRVAKSAIRVISGFLKYITGGLRRLIEGMDGTTEGFQKRVIVFEMYLIRIEDKIEKFYKNAIPKLIGFAKAVWAGLAPFRWLAQAVKVAANAVTGFISVLTGVQVGNSDLLQSGTALLVFFYSLTRVGAILTRVFTPVVSIFTSMGRAFTFLDSAFGKIFSKFGMLTRFGVTMHRILGGGILAKLLGTAGPKLFGIGLLKRIPIIGLGFAIYDMIKRFRGGDVLGGFIALAEGVSSLFPGVGTAVSLALAGLNVARDVSGNGLSNKEGGKDKSMMNLSGRGYEESVTFRDGRQTGRHQDHPYVPKQVTMAPVINQTFNINGGDPNELRTAAQDGTRDGVMRGNELSIRGGLQTNDSQR